MVNGFRVDEDILLNVQKIEHRRTQVQKAWYVNNHTGLFQESATKIDHSLLAAKHVYYQMFRQRPLEQSQAASKHSTCAVLPLELPQRETLKLLGQMSVPQATALSIWTTPSLSDLGATVRAPRPKSWQSSQTDSLNEPMWAGLSKGRSTGTSVICSIPATIFVVAKLFRQCLWIEMICLFLRPIFLSYDLSNRLMLPLHRCLSRRFFGPAELRWMVKW